ncbi:hypothetical protein F5Y17DRAFT_460435 [Xylariaceae sp. FL0594]|nr:hypothetical protein F5Y17DRAFT_460435 [Xylariaceae sp. FL0594]
MCPNEPEFTARLHYPNNTLSLLCVCALEELKNAKRIRDYRLESFTTDENEAAAGCIHEDRFPRSPSLKLQKEESGADDGQSEARQPPPPPDDPSQLITYLDRATAIGRELWTPDSDEEKSRIDRVHDLIWKSQLLPKLDAFAGNGLPPYPDQPYWALKPYAKWNEWLVEKFGIGRDEIENTLGALELVLKDVDSKTGKHYPYFAGRQFGIADFDVWCLVTMLEDSQWLELENDDLDDLDDLTNDDLEGVLDEEIKYPNLARWRARIRKREAFKKALQITTGWAKSAFKDIRAGLHGEEARELATRELDISKDDLKVMDKIKECIA